MPCNTRHPVMLSAGLWLCLAGLPAAAQESLPTGNGKAFRERMMDWTAPAAVPAEKEGFVAEPAPADPAPALPRLSSRFGYRDDPIRGGTRLHAGIDIPEPAGAPVLSAAEGIVRFAGPAGSYGLMVEVDHGNGLTTRYAHLSKIFVREGTPVARQEEIAAVGSSGRSTGNHLHFEVRQNGRPADPLVFLNGTASSRPQWHPRGRVSLAAEAAPPHLSHFARSRADGCAAESERCAGTHAD